MRQWLAIVSASMLAACGGGGGGGGGDVGGGTAAPLNSNTASVTLTAVDSPALLAGGSSSRLMLTLGNPGTKAATGVAATLKLSSGLSKGAVSCMAAGGAVCPATPESLSVTNLPAGASLQFLIDAQVADGSSGPLVSSVAVTADNDADASDNSAQITLTAYSADVMVSGAGPTAQVSGGGVADYLMTVSNAGPDASRDLALQAAVGASQTLTSVSCVASGGAICPAVLGAAMKVPLLPKGGELSFSVSAVVRAGTQGSLGTTLHVSQAGDPVLSNNVATATASTFIGAQGSTATFITLESDGGDFVGAGRNYAYSPANAVISVKATGGHLTVGVLGNENWQADFQMPHTLAQLQHGTYTALKRYPFHNPVLGGLNWSGEGRGCNTLQGSFSVDKVSYINAELASVELQFEQHCEGATQALRGRIQWFAANSATPAGPQNPPPPALWKAPSAAVPRSGNYVFLQSDAGDFIGAGRSYSYSQADATISIGVAANKLNVGVSGNQTWSGEFQAMNGLAQLQPGYYPDLRRLPFHNPVVGGISWGGDGRGCNTLNGWFVIDSIGYEGVEVVAVDLRFEQHCEGGVPALRGQIHWVKGDPVKPAGPQLPAPAGLWAPASNALPLSGNYVYLLSDAGDFIGAGRSYLYTPANALLSVRAAAQGATVSVQGNETWSADFAGMNSITQLSPGYYGDLKRYPFHNKSFGGLNWSGEGRGCNQLTGWFVVDSVTYVNNALASIDLRFEQHCEGGAAALRGKIHWIN